MFAEVLLGAENTRDNRLAGFAREELHPVLLLARSRRAAQVIGVVIVHRILFILAGSEEPRSDCRPGGARNELVDPEAGLGSHRLALQDIFVEGLDELVVGGRRLAAAGTGAKLGRAKELSDNLMVRRAFGKLVQPILQLAGGW